MFLRNSNYALIMKQSAESVENLIELVRKRSLAVHDQGCSGPEDEQWVIRKQELCQILASVMARLNQVETQLANALAAVAERDKQVEAGQKQSKSIRQQLERLKYLLSIKDQLVLREQNEVEQLSKRNRQLERELESGILRPQGTKRRLMNLSELENNSSVQASARTSVHLCRQKSSSNQGLHAEQKQNNHLNDLQVAKLKNQLAKLQDANKVLRVQNQLLKIENQHLSEQCRLSTARQRQLHSEVIQLLTNSSQTEQIQTWSDKCSQLSLFVDRIAERSETKPANRQNKANHRYEFPHPPTPHFSSSAGFCFAKQQPKLVSTRAETMFALDELSLGEGDLCASEYPVQSEC